MNNSITYFKLKSPYEGDVTKNCALKGTEVDNNFYTLEGRDIKSVELTDGKIAIHLMNGDILSTSNITEGCIKEIAVDFDEENGVLTLTQDGVEKKITGFTTNKNILDAISANEESLEKFMSSTDETIIGTGLSNNPIGISPTSKTGQYRPVKEIIRLTDGEQLPLPSCVSVGDRYLTKEKINDFGFLYNYDGLKKIATKLKENKSLWRIPTKEDWDDMLDAVEPLDDFRTHTDARSNKFLGKVAGKLLKSVDYWKNEEIEDDSCDCTNCNNTTCECGKDIVCNPSYCGEYGACHYKDKHSHKGIDKYGFRVLPSGYANEAKDFMYFKERAYFWTASNHEYRDAYIKAFAFDRNKVLQDIFASDNYLSVRLVKDYDGSNFNGREDVLGQTYSTVLMPSKKNGKSIWTSVNVSFGDCGCGCKHILPNDGQGMEYTIRYFVNEWNGKGWLRKEVKDGESVVVLKRSSKDSENNPNKDYTEYRVVNEELVDVASFIYNDVVDRFKPITDNLQKNVDELNDKLDTEIKRATEKEEELSRQIENANGRIDVAENDIKNNKESISKVNQTIVTVNENLVTAINTINNNVADGFNTINGGIEEERQTRANKDTELENKINEEVENRKRELEKVSQDIQDEANIRQTNDEKLQKEIEEEKKERTSSDEEINKAIDECKVKDEVIEGKLLAKDGTSFDASTGILTLKSNNGTNDIDVQFSMNFGTF